MPCRYGGHAADGGTFTIVRFPEINLPDVVCMEYRPTGTSSTCQKMLATTAR